MTSQLNHTAAKAHVQEMLRAAAERRVASPGRRRLVRAVLRPAPHH